MVKSTNLVFENEEWVVFSVFGEEGESSILVVNKEDYSNPKKYNSVIGKWFGSKSIYGEDIENGSFLKELIDEWFNGKS